MKTATRPGTQASPAERDGQRRLLSGVGLLIAAFLVFFPAKQLIDQRGRINELEARLAVLTAENERLADEVSSLEDPEELELLARERLGMVRPGEQVYLFVPPGEETGAAPEPVPSEEEPSLLRRWWTGFFDLLRGEG